MSESTELSITEAEIRFVGEWIFMAITQKDTHGMGTGGHIVAYSSSHDEVAESARLWIEAHPGQLNAFFYSGEPQGIVVI